MEIHHNIKDIFCAPRLAVSLTKILTCLRANIVGFIAYLIANYLALLSSGFSLREVWEIHGIYPCAYIYELRWYSSLLFWASTIYWFLAIYGSMVQISKITLQELKGDFFYSLENAHNFIEKNWQPVIFAPLSILAILAFYILATSFFGFIAKTPLVGSIFLAFPFIVYIFGAVFALFTFFTLIISIFYTPAIVGALKEDTMGCVFNIYLLTWRYPLQLIVYKLILFPLIYLSQFVLAIALGFGFKIVDLIFSNALLMGEKFSAIVGNATKIAIPKELFEIIFGSYIVSYYDFFITTSNKTLNNVESISSFFIGIFILLMVLGCFSYALSVFSTGSVFILNILKYKSGVNIVSIKDESDFIETKIEK